MQTIKLNELHELKFANGFQLQFTGSVWINETDKQKARESNTFDSRDLKHQFTINVDIGELTLKDILNDVMQAKTSLMVKAQSRIRKDFKNDAELEKSDKRTYSWKLNQLIARAQKPETIERKKRDTFKMLDTVTTAFINTMNGAKVPVTIEMITTFVSDQTTVENKDFVAEWLESFKLPK